MESPRAACYMMRLWRRVLHEFAARFRPLLPPPRHTSAKRLPRLVLPRSSTARPPAHRRTRNRDATMMV